MKKWTPKECAEYVNEDFINLLLSDEYETVLRIFSFDERDEYNRLLGEKKSERFQTMRISSRLTTWATRSLTT